MKSPSAALPATTLVTTAVLLFAALSAPARAGELELAQARMLRLQAVCEQGLANLDKTLTAASDVEWRDAVHAWHERHADALAELRGLQQRVAELTELANPRQPPGEPPVPADVPAAVRPALEEARILRLEAAQVEYQARGASAVDRRDALHAWHEQNAARLAANADRLRAVLPAPNPPVVVTAPLDLPADLDPEIRRRLLERAALDAELTALTRQLRDASPVARRDALHSWLESQQQRIQAAIVP